MKSRMFPVFFSRYSSTRTFGWFRIALGICCWICSMTALAAQPPEVLDDFDDASRWIPIVADGVTMETRTERGAGSDGGDSTALRLDVDFVTGGGYAGVRRALPLDLPANFELAFSVRGTLPTNNLEVKIVDESGNNVWWVNRRAFEFPSEWTRLASRRRHFQFAWGPSPAALRRASAIEIVIASAEGGNGTVYLDDLTFRPLPETKPYTGTPRLTASSQRDRDSQPANALDHTAKTKWRPADEDPNPSVAIDFRTTREFGGLVLHWDEASQVERTIIEFSDDGEQWTTVRTVGLSRGNTQFVALPDAETQMIRLSIKPRSTNADIALGELEILPLESSRDPNAFAAEIARRAPRGYYPRATHGGDEDGTFWTVVGTDQSADEALVSEDGAVEVNRRAFSIEPFVYVDGKLHSWADATTTQQLAHRFAPVPTVTRSHGDWSLSVTVSAHQSGAGTLSTMFLLDTIENKSSRVLEGSLFLALRPFQVNPPYQWLNTVGGVSRIGRISQKQGARAVEVDDWTILLGETPNAFGCATFDEGDITTYLANGDTPPHRSVEDPQWAASGVIRYDFRIPAGEQRSWALCVPSPAAWNSKNDKTSTHFAETDDRKKAVAFVTKRQSGAEWKSRTGKFQLLLPDEFREFEETVRSTLAYILINRDGAAIQPGSRSYERSWIRDGSMTTSALLRFGLTDAAREFVDWYAAFQFEDGKIPCVVDRRGPDPVPENDSHGQFIFAVMNVYRFTGDRSFLAKHWPRVEKAVGYIEQLRAQRMTPEYSDPSRSRQEPGHAPVPLTAFHGLMPESISHEGYSAKPMHSYWDDFFTLKGLKDAAEMARALGKDESAERYQTLADDFARTLYQSIDAAMAAHDIDYIPGCVEFGDFDATSTTVALWPCGELDRLPRPALDRTFEIYWDGFRKRRDDPTYSWDGYVPYEMRCVGSLIVLGKVDEAHQALDYYMNHCRPRAWNQWPEIVYRNARTPRFAGDIPHTWCGSDFLNAVRMVFLFERESDEALIVFAGVPESWISSTPVGFHDMPTYGGSLSCTMARDGTNTNRVTIELTGRGTASRAVLPKGGIRLTNPCFTTRRATINGKAAEIDPDGRVIVREVPATVELVR